MTVTLPDELAPTLRAAAEQLLAEVTVTHPPEPRRGVNPRGACCVCHKTGGRMGGHHVVPGDHSSVVPVHPRCHSKLHRRGKPRQGAVAGATA